MVDITLFMQGLVSGLLLGGLYAMIAVGLTVIFGVMDVVNFAHGSLLMLGMYITFTLTWHFGINPYLTLIVSVPVLFVIGAGIQRFTIQPILGDHTLQILVTLGLMFLIENLAQVIWKAVYRSLFPILDVRRFELGSIIISEPRLIALLMSILATIVLVLFLTKTYTGKAMRACAQDRTAAQMMGIDLEKMYAIAFGIGAALVGLAGSLLVPFYYVFPTVGLPFALLAFVIVVLGSLGSVTGATIGGFLIGVVESMGTIYISSEWRLIIIFVIFIGILVFKPEGLFSERM